jgi:hypothetical protein
MLSRTEMGTPSDLDTAPSAMAAAAAEVGGVALPQTPSGWDSEGEAAGGNKGMTTAQQAARVAFNKDTLMLGECVRVRVCVWRGRECMCGCSCSCTRTWLHAYRQGFQGL